MNQLLSLVLILTMVLQTASTVASADGGTEFRVAELTNAMESALAYDRRDWFDGLGAVALAMTKEPEVQALQKVADRDPKSSAANVMKRFNESFTRIVNFRSISNEIEGKCGPEGFQNLSGIVVDELSGQKIAASACIQPAKSQALDLDQIQEGIIRSGLLLDDRYPSVKLDKQEDAWVTPKLDFYLKTKEEARLNALETAVYYLHSKGLGFSTVVHQGLQSACGADSSCRKDLTYMAEKFALKLDHAKAPKGSKAIVPVLREKMKAINQALKAVDSQINRRETWKGGEHGSRELSIEYSFKDDAKARALYENYVRVYNEAIRQGLGTLLFTDAVGTFNEYAQLRPFKAEVLSARYQFLKDPAQLTEAQVAEALQEAADGVAMHAKETVNTNDFDSLIEGNPAAVSRVLMNKPEYAQYACKSLTRIQDAAKSWNKKRKILLWGGVIVGAVLTGGTLGAVAAGAVGATTGLAIAGTAVTALTLPAEIAVAREDYRNYTLLKGRGLAENRAEDLVEAESAYTDFLWDTGGAAASAVFLGFDGWTALKGLAKGSMAVKGTEDVMKMTAKVAKEGLDLTDVRKVVPLLQDDLAKNGEKVIRSGDELIIQPAKFADDAGSLSHLAGVFQDKALAGMVDQIKVAPRKFWANMNGKVAHFDPDTRTLYLGREWFENTAEAAAKRKEFISKMLSCS
ncbi:MAG: hypothetical protein JNL01_06775 [Bdellovibrionales bacterium]|nr:hypothetical protein [Bdellovibrionales bacterium]